jgi:glycerol uptake facilitator-like aquaporin
LVRCVKKSMRKKLLAEFVGTLALLAVVVGSGIMAQQLAAGNTAVALLGNTLATACGLYVLITMLTPISGAHFNPVVSVMAWADRALTAPLLGLYIAAQCSGAVAGAWLAHAMFDLPLLQTGTQVRTGTGQWLAEAVATAGLILTIRLFGAYRRDQVAVGVACYIAAAYWFTASTSFANPAVTLARAMTATFSGIVPAHAGAFIAAQCLGAVMGYGLARALLPPAAARS